MSIVHVTLLDSYSTIVAVDVLQRNFNVGENVLFRCAHKDVFFGTYRRRVTYIKGRGVILEFTGYFPNYIGPMRRLWIYYMPGYMPLSRRESARVAWQQITNGLPANPDKVRRDGETPAS